MHTRTVLAAALLLAATPVVAQLPNAAEDGSEHTT